MRTLCAGALGLVLATAPGCLQPGFRGDPLEVSSDAVIVDVPVVRQEELHECGLATMAALLDYYSVPFPAEEQTRLAELARAGPGLSGAELRDGLRRLGLEAFLYHGSLDRSTGGILGCVDASTPPMVLIGSDEEDVNHYTLVTGYEPDASSVYLFDPARGNVRMTREEFLSRWRNTGSFTLLAFPAPSKAHG
jgi:ABC-type bacteriocin/lantibiotic exporter with double-glycine peptidase domain